MIQRNTQGRSKANKIARQLRVLSTFKIKAGDANDPGYVAYVNLLTMQKLNYLSMA